MISFDGRQEKGTSTTHVQLVEFRMGLAQVQVIFLVGDAG